MRCLAIPLAALFLVASAAAQEFRGTINGRVTDPSSNPIPNAKVTLKNSATNEQIDVNTTEGGDYTANFVLPGRYTITVPATGFKQSMREGVEVRVSEKVTSDFQLEVGPVTESVTVTSEAPLIEATSADRSGV